MGERRRRRTTIEWQVIRLRSNGEYLGVVTAPDDDSAVKAALKAFALAASEANRLLVRRIVRR